MNKNMLDKMHNKNYKDIVSFHSKGISVFLLQKSKKMLLCALCQANMWGRIKKGVKQSFKLPNEDIQKIKNIINEELNAR